MCGKNSKFVITEDGMQLVITYEWPKVLFNASDLFSQSMASNGKPLDKNHLKIHSFVSHLHSSGATAKSKFQSTVTIQLPKKVQREIDSWIREKVIVNDTKIVILTFSAFQKSLIINDADTSLDF